MGLTAQQLTYLKTADQRFRARVAVFPAYTPTISYTQPGSSGTALAPKPMPMVSPRLSVINNGASITLYATDSYNRGGAYVGNGNIAWANTGGAGTLTNNGDGTATYTAPGAGSGTNAITMTATNSNGTRDAICYVQYPDTTNDAIVAEVASISGGVEQRGWKVLLRVAGNASAFTIGSRLLVHVEDTWNGTTSTFGGYKYSEGVFSGYISQVEYFEDAFGQTYVGVECSPLWWLLERLRLGETWWGLTAASGRFYIANFAPTDAIWHFVNIITDVSKYHNCTLFFDSNVMDDVVIEESNLSTIIRDCAARGLSQSFTDRYGSLMCIPDPDVRAGEWWGTPSPVFDSAGAGALTEAFCQDYTITYNPYKVRKLIVQALDHSKLGLWAISQNTASSLGEILSWPGKLFCDNPAALAQWTVQLRAKMNRRWQLNVTRYLDHTLDLMNFVDVNFTSPSQTNGLTASGTTWVNSISYRPNVFDGGWVGSMELLKQTTADTDGSSAWGGTGQFWGGVPEWPSDGPGSGSWNDTAGGVTAFCHMFDFVNSGAQGWKVGPNYISGSYSGVPGEYLQGWGWSARDIFQPWGTPEFTAGHLNTWLNISRTFPTRNLTTMNIYMINEPQTSTNSKYFDVQVSSVLSASSVVVLHSVLTPFPGSETVGVAIYQSSNAMRWAGFVGNHPPNAGDNPDWRIVSAEICGLGADPFN